MCGCHLSSVNNDYVFVCLHAPVQTSAARLWTFSNSIDSLIVQLLSYITLQYLIIGLTSVLYIEHNENLGSLYLTQLSR